jgi:hypothetical protein
MLVLSLLLLLLEEEVEEGWSVFLECSFNHRDIEGMPAVWKGSAVM